MTTLQVGKLHYLKTGTIYGPSLCVVCLRGNTLLPWEMTPDDRAKNELTYINAEELFVILEIFPQAPGMSRFRILTAEGIHATLSLGFPDALESL